MNLLAFDTSTDRFSVALMRGSEIWQCEGIGGAQASVALLPSIAELLQQAELTLHALDAIVFGRGPGSFTGLRTACSVAQGLAFGAQASHSADADYPLGKPAVLAVDTLLAVAEEARYQQGCNQVVAVLDARMDEVYFADYRWQNEVWTQPAELGLAAPENVQLPLGWCVAGNAYGVYGDRLAVGANQVCACLPTATALLRLAPALLAAGYAVPAAQALPLYVRDKVAQTTQERAALRAQLDAQSAGVLR